MTEVIQRILDRLAAGSHTEADIMTLGAYAFCKVDADIASIKAGDPLPNSPTN